MVSRLELRISKDSAEPLGLEASLANAVGEVGPEESQTRRRTIADMMQKGYPRRALRIIDHLLQRGDRHPVLRLVRAECLWRLRRREEALIAMQKGIEFAQRYHVRNETLQRAKDALELWRGALDSIDSSEEFELDDPQDGDENEGATA